MWTSSAFPHLDDHKHIAVFATCETVFARNNFSDVREKRAVFGMLTKFLQRLQFYCTQKDGTKKTIGATSEVLALGEDFERFFDQFGTGSLQDWLSSALEVANILGEHEWKSLSGEQIRFIDTQLLPVLESMMQNLAQMPETI
jgi:hypothetical protein